MCRCLVCWDHLLILASRVCPKLLEPSLSIHNFHFVEISDTLVQSSESPSWAGWIFETKIVRWLWVLFWSPAMYLHRIETLMSRRLLSLSSSLLMVDIAQLLVFLSWVELPGTWRGEIPQRILTLVLFTAESGLAHLQCRQHSSLDWLPTQMPGRITESTCTVV